MGGRVAIVADRLGWEEKQLIQTVPSLGLRAEWVNDEALCLGGPQAEALARYDLVMIRSRSYTRGGLLAGLSEASNIPTVNRAGAIRACENKLTMRLLLRTAGVPVPDFRLVLSRRDFERALEQLPTPVVLKPVYGGMGKRVTLLRHADAAHSVYDYVEDLGHGFEQACLVEEYLGGSSVRCLVVGTELVSVARFENRGADWRSNAALGGRTLALGEDPELGKLVGRVVDELGPGIYGIDLFRTPSGYVVNEVNHAPAFRGVTAATGADVPSAIGRFLKEALT